MVKCTKAQVRRLKTALRWKGDPKRRQRIQMVLLREGGMTQPAIAEAMGQDHWLAISGIVKHAALHGDSLVTFAHFDRGYPASQEMTGGRDGPAGLGEAPRWAGLARAIIAWKAAFMIESIMYFGIGFL